MYTSDTYTPTHLHTHTHPAAMPWSHTLRSVPVRPKESHLGTRLGSLEGRDGPRRRQDRLRSCSCLKRDRTPVTRPKDAPKAPNGSAERVPHDSETTCACSVRPFGRWWHWTSNWRLPPTAARLTLTELAHSETSRIQDSQDVW